MSEKITDGSSEAQRRAEKIKAIRRSIRSEAEVAPMTYENKSESERSESIADRIAKVKEKRNATAADILEELDEAIAREKADAKRLAAEKAEAAERAAANASPDISDIIPALSSSAHGELSELVDEITEDFTEVSGDITEYEEDFTEVQTAEKAETEEKAETFAEEADAPENVSGTMVFTPPAKEAEDQRGQYNAVREVKAPEPNIRAAEEIPSAGVKKPAKKKKKKKKKTFGKRLLGMLPQKGDGLGERIRKIIFLGSVVAIVTCGYIVGDYYYELWASRHKTQDLMEMYDGFGEQDALKEEEEGSGEVRVRYMGMLDGARKLWEQNHDIVGVISIPDTPVNNPVMQSEDNTKYLNRKFDLSENRAGEIFLDYRNHFDEVDDEGYVTEKNSDNLVIYGHNMLDEQMFGSLKYYQWREDYYGQHPVINLSSNYENYKYKIFAFFILDADDETDTKFDCWNDLDFNDEKEFYDFVNEAKKRTLRLNNVDVKYGDPLITLSTCNTTIPKERGRLIIMARRVRDGEDPYEGTQDSRPNPNIKWPTMYYDEHPDEKYDPNGEFVPYGPAEAEKNK